MKFYGFKDGIINKNLSDTSLNNEEKKCIKKAIRLIKEDKIKPSYRLDINNVICSDEEIGSFDILIQKETDLDELKKLIKQRDSRLSMKRKDLIFIIEEIKKYEQKCK